MKAFTHGGVFHADDVFATALLKKVYPDLEIERGFKVPEDYDGIVFDIGGGKFDHHQPDDQKEVRLNGIPYAAFGKLWREFGEQVCGNVDVAEKIDETLVQHIDLQDNGGDRNPLSDAIGAFNKNWDERVNPSELFEKAVDIAGPILDREIERELSLIKAKDIAMEAYENSDKSVVALDQFAPCISHLVHTDAKFFVFPGRVQGEYNLQVVPDPEKPQLNGRSQPKIPISEKANENMSFCVNVNFMAGYKTKEDAIAAAHQSIKEYEHEQQMSFFGNINDTLETDHFALEGKNEGNTKDREENNTMKNGIVFRDEKPITK